MQFFYFQLLFSTPCSYCIRRCTFFFFSKVSRNSTSVFLSEHSISLKHPVSKSFRHTMSNFSRAYTYVATLRESYYVLTYFVLEKSCTSREMHDIIIVPRIYPVRLASILSSRRPRAYKLLFSEHPAAEAVVGVVEKSLC